LVTDEALVLTHIQDHIAVVTLNRPGAMNALSAGLIEALDTTAASLRDNDDVWVVILKSSSEKAFCVGADLKERKGKSLEAVQVQRRHMVRAFNALAELPKPVIISLHGYALGGGLELALTGDIIIASSDAVMGLPEVGLAVIPGAGGTQRLPRIIGRMKAKEMILSGERISAAEAEKIGLVTRVVPRAELDAEALKLARRMAENAPLAMAQAKRAIDVGMDMAISAGLAYETECYDVVLKSEDRNEGLLAFTEKRKPVYKRK
jgi:enoyl-CoA hydratase/carnithine racemase